MGAWDAGSFQNDAALDWTGDLCDSGDVAPVRAALNRAIEQRPSQQPSFIGKLLGQRPVESTLDSHEACQALAAAEIVAFWLGHPGPGFPQRLAEWAHQHSASLSPDLVSLACKAVRSVRTKSELKDLWEEGDRTVALDWYEAIADLERRLQT